MKQLTFKKSIVFLFGVLAISAGATFMSTKKVDKVIKAARTYTGVRYQIGGMDRKGIDCSALMLRSFASIGYTLPRVSWMQATVGKPVPLDKLQLGDLVFFGHLNSTKVSHVGMVTVINSKTDIKFINATCSKGVMESNLYSNYWKSRLLKARRVPLGQSDNDSNDDSDDDTADVVAVNDSDDDNTNDNTVVVSNNTSNNNNSSNNNSSIKTKFNNVIKGNKNKTDDNKGKTNTKNDHKVNLNVNLNIGHNNNKSNTSNKTKKDDTKTKKDDNKSNKITNIIKGNNNKSNNNTKVKKTTNNNSTKKEKTVKEKDDNKVVKNNKGKNLVKTTEDTDYTISQNDDNNNTTTVNPANVKLIPSENNQNNNGNQLNEDNKKKSENPLFDKVEFGPVFFGADNVVKKAKSYMGTQFKKGGMDENGIDVIGLLSQAFSKVDAFLPDNYEDFKTMGVKADLDYVEMGDVLLFAAEPGKKDVIHAGMISEIKGNSLKGYTIKFIHVLPGKGVIQTIINDKYWRDRVIGVRRLY